jgi:hypothetical protein
MAIIADYPSKGGINKIAEIHGVSNETAFRIIKKGIGFRGDSKPGAKLTEIDVREIRRRFSAGETLRELAGCFGVNDSNISHIVRRRNWQWVK